MIPGMYNFQTFNTKITKLMKFNSPKTPLRLLSIQVQILSGMRWFVHYVITISLNCTKYMYITLVPRETVTRQTQ